MAASARFPVINLYVSAQHLRNGSASGLLTELSPRGKHSIHTFTYVLEHFRLGFFQTWHNNKTTKDGPRDSPVDGGNATHGCQLP